MNPTRLMKERVKLEYDIHSVKVGLMNLENSYNDLLRKIKEEKDNV